MAGLPSKFSDFRDKKMVILESYVERRMIRNGDGWKWRETTVKIEENGRVRCTCIGMGVTHMARGILGS